MSKVASARRKAEEMRVSAEAQQAEQLRKVNEKAANIRKTHHFPGGLTVCFARKMWWIICNVIKKKPLDNM